MELTFCISLTPKKAFSIHLTHNDTNASKKTRKACGPLIGLSVHPSSRHSLLIMNHKIKHWNSDWIKPIQVSKTSHKNQCISCILCFYINWKNRKKSICPYQQVWVTAMECRYHTGSKKQKEKTKGCHTWAAPKPGQELQLQLKQSRLKRTEVEDWTTWSMSRRNVSCVSPNFTKTYIVPSGFIWLGVGCWGCSHVGLH